MVDNKDSGQLGLRLSRPQLGSQHILHTAWENMYRGQVVKLWQVHHRRQMLMCHNHMLIQRIGGRMPACSVSHGEMQRPQELPVYVPISRVTGNMMYNSLPVVALKFAARNRGLSAVGQKAILV